MQLAKSALYSLFAKMADAVASILPNRASVGGLD
jgi:hypothetical protein